MLKRLIARLWPDSMFGRIAWLLTAAVLCSHALALTLMFELRPQPPHRPPPPFQPAMTQAGPTFPGPHPPRPGPGPIHGGPASLLDIGVRLSMLLLAGWVGARWLTAPIRQLARAAQELGHDIQRPPLPETGTSECREATRVFNQMQARVLAQIQEREQFVAAMSHDLRTPLTRMRLRCESLPNSDIRSALGRDVADMEQLLSVTLDYLRGATQPEALARIDIEALVHSVADDETEQGHVVSVQGQAAPIAGQPLALRRCLDNLVSNAIRYGHEARIVLSDSPQQATIDICDRGPGLPAEELDKVLQPFYRVESSRNRALGGVGLGLSIANEIARRHGSCLLIDNLPEGGLRVRLTLPRHTS